MKTREVACHLSDGGIVTTFLTEEAFARLMEVFTRDSTLPGWFPINGKNGELLGAVRSEEIQLFLAQPA